MADQTPGMRAAGTEGGYIVIWDFETRGVAKVLQGHRCARLHAKLTHYTSPPNCRSYDISVG